MPPQNLIYIFILKLILFFDIYLIKISKLRKILINIIKYAQYLDFFPNFKQKIIEKNKIKRANFYSKSSIPTKNSI